MFPSHDHGGVKSGPAKSNATEEYDGTSWTTSGSMNTARSEFGGAGIQTSTLAFGGEAAPGNTSAVESYTGSTWANNPNSLSSARRGSAGTGTGIPSAIVFGGYTTTYTGVTEEYSRTTNVSQSRSMA